MKNHWHNPALALIYNTELARFINTFRASGIQFVQRPVDEQTDWQIILSEHGFVGDVSALTIVEANGLEFVFSTGQVGSADSALAGEHYPYGVLLFTRNAATGNIAERVCYDCPEGNELPYRGANALMHCYHLHH